jgi:hypothetical protein
MFSLSNVCSAISIPLSSSASSFIWGVIHFLWSWYGIWIFVILSVWTIVELFTRNGQFHYNSENGFSPTFNIFVGSGLYWGIQSLLLILLEKLFGESVYCLIWPYPVHIVIFLLTGLILHVTGFWPYLKEPGMRRSYRKYGHIL